MMRLFSKSWLAGQKNCRSPRCRQARPLRDELVEKSGNITSSTNRAYDDDDLRRLFFEIWAGCAVYCFFSESIVAMRRPVQLLGKATAWHCNRCRQRRLCLNQQRGQSEARRQIDGEPVPKICGTAICCGQRRCRCRQTGPLHQRAGRHRVCRTAVDRIRQCRPRSRFGGQAIPATGWMCFGYLAMCLPPAISWACPEPLVLCFRPGACWPSPAHARAARR